MNSSASENTTHEMSPGHNSWKERWDAAEDATQRKDWQRAAELWASLFYDAVESKDRVRTGRRATIAFRRSGNLQDAQQVMEAIIWEAPNDRVTRHELARLHTAISRNEVENRYWHDREMLLYMHVAKDITTRIASNANSLVDVGSRDTPLLESFPTVPLRISIDLDKPYRSPGIYSIKQDFMAWDPGTKFDVGVCLQVLEHVPDARSFAQRLLGLFDVVVVSVPYMWPKGKTKGHVHDPVDETKLGAWFQRPPNFSYRIAELSGMERLICVYEIGSERKWATIDPDQFRYRWTLRGAEEIVGRSNEFNDLNREEENAVGSYLEGLQSDLRRIEQEAADLRGQYQRLRSRRSVQVALRLAELVGPLVRLRRRK